MAFRDGLFTEAALVGASFAGVGLGLKYLYRKAGWDEEFPAPRREVPMPVFLFVTGAAGHLLWEAVGGNRKFAANFAATLPPEDRREFASDLRRALVERSGV